MRLYDVKGRTVTKNVSEYLIKWDGQSRSKIQRKIKLFLMPYWRGHIVYEEFPVYGTKMKVDILNATRKIAVEVNGEQHGTFNPFFHNNDELVFLRSIKRDVKKMEWLELNGYTLVDIEANEIDNISAEFFKKNYNIIL